MKIELLIIFFSILIGGGSVIFLKINEVTLKLLLSFSGAYLLSICVLHLLPEIFSGNDAQVGGYVLLGYFIQISIEYFSKGIEHGHAHIHNATKRALPISLLIALSIHSIIEGMPLADVHEHHSHTPLLLGIVLHKIPIAIALVSLLIQLELSKGEIFGVLILFASMTPFGTLLSHYLQAEEILSHKATFIVLAMAVGIFLHISTTILLESSENHRFNTFKLLTMGLGTALAFFF